MPQTVAQEDIIKVLPKGLITIPKKFRDDLGFEENGLAQVKSQKGKLIISPLRTLPYRVRSYTDKEIDQFFAFDDKESKALRKKGLL